jgi:hypothetical protein
MNRSYVRAAAALFALAGIAACSDAPMAPQAAKLSDAQRKALIDAPAAAPVKAPKSAVDAGLDVAASATDTVRTSFQVGPEGGVFAIGRHWISFPANAVCDPSQSSYGEGEWNNDCVIATEPVTIDAVTFADSTGAPMVEFAQHLRFDPTKQVILHMSFDYRSGDDAPDILWQKAASDSAVNEGDEDPALVTRDGNYWMVYRRVKHFSGYTLSTGCLGVRVDVGIDLGLNRSGSQFQMPAPEPLRSGHVVATGRANAKPR